jgi:hypothetical protein
MAASRENRSLVLLLLNDKLWLGSDGVVSGEKPRVTSQTLIQPPGALAATAGQFGLQASR